MLAYYPEKVKKWIARREGLTADMKTMQSGPELWAIVAPCPEEVVGRGTRFDNAPALEE
jgi:hypothetical protein